MHNGLKSCLGSIRGIMLSMIFPIFALSSISPFPHIPQAFSKTLHHSSAHSQASNDFCIITFQMPSVLAPGTSLSHYLPYPQALPHLGTTLPLPKDSFIDLYMASSLTAFCFQNNVISYLTTILKIAPDLSPSNFSQLLCFMFQITYHYPWWLRICLQCRIPGFDPGWEDLLEKEMATHSSILTWRIKWTEKPDGYIPQGQQRVGLN